MERLSVALGERSYQVVAGCGNLGAIGAELKSLGPGPKAALVTNPTVLALYGKTVRASLEEAGFETVVITVPDGEKYKTLLWVEHILTEMLKARLDRGSTVLALGGGVVGDMAGFAASLYMRGIRCVQLPTTLLAQVDSSVGGKTGVNHALGKNMIGSFWQPSLVWIDSVTLKTLPKRELLAGISEVIKYGIIWDAGFSETLLRDREGLLALEPEPITAAIKRSCEIKAEVVARDEREAGLRSILNYGHTIGHAIENAAGYGKLLHGEAVAIGMALEAELAARLGVAGPETPRRIKDIIASFGLPTELPPGHEAGPLIEAMELDKKTLSGELRFTLPVEVGKVELGVKVTRETLRELL